jgi:hypothetical protein
MMGTVCGVFRRLSRLGGGQVSKNFITENHGDPRRKAEMALRAKREIAGCNSCDGRQSGGVPRCHCEELQRRRNLMPRPDRIAASLSFLAMTNGGVATVAAQVPA